MIVAYDSFVRGGLERTCEGRGNCSWCGQKRSRVYSYVASVDGHRNAPWDYYRGVFCNLECFRAYHS